jgi:hypothetical protein
MDYTPCTFSDSQHPHITTHAHELALTVLFESGLQHLADRPESYLAQPQQVQQFLSRLPSVWDETRFVDGYPGKSVIMARRSGTTWYVGAMTGNEARELDIDLRTILQTGKRYTLYAYEDDPAVATQTHVRCSSRTLRLTSKSRPLHISLLPSGGAAFRIEEAK